MQGFLRKAAAAASALLLCTVMQVSAADDSPMIFRITGSQTYFTESDLSQGDAVIDGALYIDNYSGISAMRVILKSDAPLVIENGKFSDPPFFEADGPYSTYMQKSAETDAANVIVWNGPDNGTSYMNIGTVANKGGSFTDFQIRIPKGTPAGVYRCYISEEVTVNSVGLKEYDFYVYCGDDKVDVAKQAHTVVVEPDSALRGDADADGSITVFDAQAALRYYTNVHLLGIEPDDAMLSELLNTPYIHTGLAGADVSGDGDVSLNDAVSILRYYSFGILGKTPSWEDVLV